MEARIYFDNNASTPIDPRVLQVLIQELSGPQGNPSSTHFFGQQIRAKLTNARQAIATYLGVKSNEIIFNSGATEGLNMLLRGFSELHPKGHIISSDVEHACVYSTLKILESKGQPLTFLKTGLYGAVSPESLLAAIRPDTKLITLMAVNNETGVKTDIQSIASIAYEAKIPFITDGVALLGKGSFSVHPGITAMCFSGHKLHAPKGVGFSFIRHHFKIKPLQTGGEQEFHRRGGTENVAGILALAEAVHILKAELKSASEHMQGLRDYFEMTLKSALPFITINGIGPRIGNTSNVAFGRLDGEALLMRLDQRGVAVSHGSACNSGALEPSRILLKMGLPMELARSSIRFSLSRFNTLKEVEKCAEIVIEECSNSRSVS